MKWFTKNKVNREEQDTQKSTDFLEFYNKSAQNPYLISYYTSLIDEGILQKNILPYLIQENISAKNVSGMIPVTNIYVTTSNEEVKKCLLKGYIHIAFLNEKDQHILIPAKVKNHRQITQPEVEFSVLGPKEAFVESLDINLGLIRKRVPSLDLQVQKLQLGSITKTQVAILYIKNIANDENVKTVIQRLKAIDFDQITDSSFIAQLITDNSNSPFPQLVDSERPDRVSSVLVEGKVVMIVDGSPHALIGPTTLVEFFSAFEDYFSNWIVTSFIRLIRLFAVTFSILSTPIYVAILTYHYELIPKDLMSTLVGSRSTVPFPPIFEALFLEVTIELLREAGARLPTKVGQTIGIVGGIVIGTASVEAGLTSNVLLIIVALAALASFTTPVYRMGNTIRVLRFPFLILAQFWGLLGIVICLLFLIVHLLRLTSLGRPYFEPIFPLRPFDLRDAFIRLPFSVTSKRPIYLQTTKTKRFTKREGIKTKDIDE